MATEMVGKSCKLLTEIRDRNNQSRPKNEEVVILKEVVNLERLMYLCRFSDGVTTFLFPHEVELL